MGYSTSRMFLKATVLLFSLLAWTAPTPSMASPIPASNAAMVQNSYSSTLSLQDMRFSRTHKTSAYRLTGKNVGIDIRCAGPKNGSMSITLYRNNVAIGTDTVKRNGFVRARWQNVGSGSYRFELRNGNDGQWITISSLKVYNW